MYKTSSLFVLVAVALASSACGGGASGGGGIDPPPPAISVSVSPSTATVSAGGTQQFSATVTGSSNTAVTWSVSAAVANLPQQAPGTVSASGLYTAPATVEGTFTATVTATASADSTKSASATITVIPPDNQPDAQWIKTVGSTDALATLGSLITSDAAGDVFFTAGVGSISAYELDPNGNTIASYQGNDGLIPASAVSDGTNFYVVLDGATSAPHLITLGPKLANPVETSSCDASMAAGALTWEGKDGLKVALVSPSGSSISTVNTATGAISCKGIPVRSEPTSFAVSLTESPNGNQNVLGFFPGTQLVCWSGMEGFLGQVSMQGTQSWMLPFASFAPSTLTYQMRSVETTESGKDVIYVAGAYITCNGNDPLYVAKYDAATGAQLWSQTWDTGNTVEAAGMKGAQVTPILIPGGGVAVVGTAVQVGFVPPKNGVSNVDMVFAAYDAFGNELVAEHVPLMDGADLGIEGAVATPDGKGFYAGGFNNKTSQGIVLRFNWPAKLTGN